MPLQMPTWSRGAALTPLSFCPLTPLLQLLMSLERPSSQVPIVQFSPTETAAPSLLSTDHKLLFNPKAVQGLAPSKPCPGRCTEDPSLPKSRSHLDTEVAFHPSQGLDCGHSLSACFNVPPEQGTKGTGKVCVPKTDASPNHEG